MSLFTFLLVLSIASLIAKALSKISFFGTSTHETTIADEWSKFKANRSSN